MRIVLTPTRQSIEPGREAVFSLTVTNTASVIASHQIKVLGLDPSWVRIDDEVISLFPDDTGSTTIHLTLPLGVPSGTRQFVIEVESLTPPIENEQVRGELVIPERSAMRLSLDPPSTTAPKEARIGVVLLNNGTSEIDARLQGHDDPEEVAFSFEPEVINLQPGEQFLATGRLRAKRPWFGSPKVRSYQISTSVREQVVSTQGSWVQSPRLSRGVLALLGLVIAGTIFAAVIAGSLSQVVDRSNANSQLALQVAQASQNKAIAGTASISGSVKLATTQAPVSGVTVDLYQTSNLSSPAASVATNANGSYSFASLAAGSYDLSFTGAGFSQLWYPDSTTSANGQKVVVANGQKRTGINISIGALPVTVSGGVTGLSPAGAELALQLPAANPLASVSTGSNSGATAVANGIIVAKTTLTASGSFSFTNIPSPETYQLVLTKNGDAPVVQTVTLASGQSQSGISLVLTPGNGVISGTVEGPSGPIGGATIAATVGTATSSTVSLTTAPKLGDFTLTDLSTPADVSLQVTAPGYAAQTLSVTLAPSQQVSGILVTLQPGVGSISGVVTTPANTPAGGVTVTTNFGSKTLTTVTASTGKVGSFTIANLSVPGTYTVTFSRPDLLSQTVIVDLSSGTPNATGVNTSMVTNSSSVSGVVTQTSGGGIANATVELVSGAATYSVQTASSPTPGAYLLAGVKPGTYTLNFTRVGGLPVSTIVTLTAGESLTKNQQLSPAAAITGQVVNASSGQPINGAVIDLYLSAQYAPGATPLATATTDSNGNFTLSNLEAPQSYLVTIAYPPGSAPATSYNVTTQAGVTVCAVNGSTTTTTSCQIQLQVNG
ncbi:carboxypeptidase-like regulatory domain-containing protein [Ferrimicrobium acidiphilum]|uniref:carboxypeptidase-like regulatory domain-containing protein n=1 Tax=Ferrimicrobium acidiphilum TaxID=121039 RepID=UPI0023F1C4E4|nr:carboxypeptidase-like regulatory domain-containing protein [Ferrimicrobium acidiphilum]